MRALAGVLALAALLLAPSAEAKTADAFIGPVWGTPTMVIQDRWTGRVPSDLVSSFAEATGVPVSVRESKPIRCGSWKEKLRYARHAKLHQVLLCNMDKDLANLALIDGYTNFWMDANRERIERAAVAIVKRRWRPALCHELAHVFGLGHWDRALFSPESCVYGTQETLGRADREALRLVYQEGWDPKDPATEAELTHRLGCEIDLYVRCP